MKFKNIAYLSVLAIAMQGCFTGVESTPKITYSDVKKENIVTTPEQLYLENVHPEPPAQWQLGKKFFVTDPKVSIVFQPSAETAAETLVGREISYHAMRPFRNVAGDEITELEFVSPQGHSLIYRDNTPWREIGEKSALSIPFIIEMSVVDSVARELVGKHFYATTPLWYSPYGDNAVNGLRYVPVTIVDVKPGNDVYPILVVFRPEGSDYDYSMFMTLGNQRTSTRNFHTLFSFDDPRQKYNYIEEDVWKLIMQSKVKEGMTREECRLALGSPSTIGQRPSQGGMMEYWQYSDGVFLLFGDGGYLNYFRK